MPRLEVAIVDRDGAARVVNAARPATLVAFEDEHEGKMMPETIREIAWVVHHALGVEQPLDEWLATLEDVSAQADDVGRAKRIIGGDERARQEALGELPIADEEEAGPARPPPDDPAVAQLEEVTAGGRS